MPSCQPRANSDSGVGSSSVEEEEDEEEEEEEDEEEDEEEEEDGPDELFTSNPQNPDTIEKSSSAASECKCKRSEEVSNVFNAIKN